MCVGLIHGSTGINKRNEDGVRTFGCSLFQQLPCALQVAILCRIPDLVAHAAQTYRYNSFGYTEATGGLADWRTGGLVTIVCTSAVPEYPSFPDAPRQSVPTRRRVAMTTRQRAL